MKTLFEVLKEAGAKLLSQGFTLPMIFKATSANDGTIDGYLVSSTGGEFQVSNVVIYPPDEGFQLPFQVAFLSYEGQRQEAYGSIKPEHFIAPEDLAATDAKVGRGRAVRITARLDAEWDGEAPANAGVGEINRQPR